MKHLTHLSGFAYELNILHANQTHTLRRLADACPTLTFVELRTSSGIDASSVWVAIKRRMVDGRYDGWNLVTSLRGTPMEDWSRHFDPSTSNSNSNWDMIFENSRRGGPGQRLLDFCRPSLFLGLIFISICAAIVTLFLAQGYCSQFPIDLSRIPHPCCDGMTPLSIPHCDVFPLALVS